MRFLLLFSLFFLGFTAPLLAQDQSILRGKVLDLTTQSPLEFCTIVLMKKTDSTVVNGTTTDVEGNFSLKGDFEGTFLRIRFLGYQDYYSELPAANNGMIDMGTISMSPDSELLNRVEVRGEKSEMIFKLDKRVFNVGKDLSASGGSAIDVLNNVPSVDVTLEGIIRLRGNSGVQVLIDGKPSVLTSSSSNALGTITADMIDRIEVITNPSAKYDAEGTVGIINIVLKSDSPKGLKGSVTLNTGYPNNHSLGLSVSYRSKKANLFGQLGLGTRRFVSMDSILNTNFSDSSTSKFASNSEGEKNENFANIRLGSDFYLNDYNTITLSGHYAYELEKQYADIEYLLSDGSDVLLSNFLRNESTSATNPKYQYDLHYQKKFKRHKDQLLDFNAVGSYFGKKKTSEFTNTFISGNNLGLDQRTQIDFADVNYSFQLDYVHPIKEKWSWELGSKYELNQNQNQSEVSSLIDDVWERDSLLSNNFDYQLGILAAYTTLAYELKKWGIKGGVRMEQTNATANQSQGSIGEWNYMNFFPSVHTSYKVSKLLSFQLGYSRRIDRPYMFDLSPFFSFRDNYNLSVGNPNLQPEFANLFELTAIKNWKKFNINTSLYHSRVSGVIEEVVEVNDNLTITSPENVGESYNTGLEINAKYSPAKWISASVDGNFVYFQRQGTYNTQSFDFENYRWSSRANFKFKLPADFEVQLSVNYRSKIQYALTEEADYLFANGGIRKKFLKGKFIANLSVRDIFNSRIHRTTANQTNFSFYSRRQRGRYIVFGLSYNFGKGEAMEFSGHKMF
jgi:outer membrane receptor protein involved in Fe transport